MNSESQIIFIWKSFVTSFFKKNHKFKSSFIITSTFSSKFLIIYESKFDEILKHLRFLFIYKTFNLEIRRRGI